MTMTRTEYEASKAAIEDAWPKAMFPGMHGVMLAELNAEYQTPASAPAGAGAPSPSARKAPTSASEPAADPRQNAEYNDLFFAARLAGKNSTEAAKMAASEVERRQLVPITEADVRARFDIPTAYADQEPDPRSMDELLAAQEEQFAGSAWHREPAGVDIDRVQRHMAERSRVAARKTFADQTFRAIKSRNSALSDEVIRGIAETTATATHGSPDADLSD